MFLSFDGRDVIHSLMPKGVEHIGMGDGISEEFNVIHSLMPKGVEHNLSFPISPITLT